MNTKSSLFWLISMLTLVLGVLLVPLYSSPQEQPPLSLTSHLEVEPHFFYYNNNKFNTSVISQLRLDIKTERISHNIADYNALIVTDYEYKNGIEFSLNWQSNGQKHQVMINQTAQSINPINFHTNKTNEISDLHLLITSNLELGLNNNIQSELAFTSIQLDQLKNHSNLATYWSEWSDFTPVKISSINGYTNAADLHHKNMILLLGGWVSIVAMLYYLLRIEGKHLLFTLFIAWLISSYFYLSNHLKQHNQVSHAFSDKQRFINTADKGAYELAQLITSELKAPQNSFSSNDKIVLIGTHNFHHLRLQYHLRQFNISMNTRLKDRLAETADLKVIFLLIGRQISYCKNHQKFNWLNELIELIHVDDDFCLMREK